MGNQIAHLLSLHHSKVEGIGIDKSRGSVEDLLMNTTVFLKRFVGHAQKLTVSLQAPSEKIQFLHD